MADDAVFGEWGKFIFKMVETEDHPRVLEHLRKYFYYNALFRLGYTYTKESYLDDEMDLVFKTILNDRSNLSFIALEKSTGKVAGCRITYLEHRDHKPTGESPLQTRIVKGILSGYNKLKEECNIYERYQVDSYPHMFGISVDTEFAQQGLATEIYGQAKGLLKARNYSVALVAFIPPYSRAAAKHHGFIQLAKADLIDFVDEDGNILYPQADPENFMDHGVFKLN